MAGVNLNPYLNFRGQAAEVLDFYQAVFGGEATRTTFREGGMPIDEAEQDQIMHGQLEIGDGLTLMAADVPSSMPGDLHNGTVSLSGDDEATLRRYWDGLADGATIGEQLSKAPWGDTFGMLDDKYGVSWLMNISGSAS